MSKSKIITFLFLLSLTLSTIGQPRNISEMESKIDSIFRSLDMTGLGIAVVKDDSIIYQKSFGYKVLPQNEDKGVLLENDDIFRIASISKTFIATAILQLMEQGKLSLDDDAQKYLNFPLRNPKFPNTPITIKMLLTHTSSINDSRSYISLDRINPQLDSLYKECYSPTIPGKVYKYCNLNYTILGAVMEGITNERFYEYIDININKPIDVTGSFVGTNLDSCKFVKQYRYDDTLGRYKEDLDAYRKYPHLLDDSYELGRSLALVFPPGGMKISTGNLAKYMMMHMNYGELDGVRIINENSERLMQDNYVGKSNYGLSYRQYKDLVKGKTFYGQTGGGRGLRGSMIFDPIEKIGFVILCSGSRSKYIDGYGDIHKPLIKLLYSYLN